ncbi:hypothetical protein ACFQ78_27215 [Streptomyces sp. NPDC056519]|uniref:hypothetical protein n=1 Tax=Streptomyces sp. NPDC056519 TaxID=3345849 RepID=UPI0036CB02AD
MTAAVEKPDEVVRRALFPVVGEKTLRELVAEAKVNEKVFKAKVRTTLRSSYSSYYRQMLPPLLNTLGFMCNNTDYWPVMGAMQLLKKYAHVGGKTRFLAGWAGYGYCPSHSRFFWGLRLHLLCTPGGLPIAWALANPKTDEREVLADMLTGDQDLLTTHPGQTVIGDKGYVSGHLETSWPSTA